MWVVCRRYGMIVLFLCAVGKAAYPDNNVLPEDVFGHSGEVPKFWCLLEESSPADFALFCGPS